LTRQRTEIKVGYKCGDWTVVSIDDFKHMKSKGVHIERMWHVRCKCGVERWLRTSHLTGKLSQCCRDCSRKKKETKKIGDLPLGDINRYKYGVAKRKLEWNISNEVLWQKFIDQSRNCALTGVELFFSNSGVGTPGAKDISTASLDRIDSSKGYVEGNVQWVHKVINNMKSNLNEQDFINWCKIISKHNK
jgi:hypothetical protein